MNPSPRPRPSSPALAAAAVTGLIAFALFVGGGLLLWANGHYKDAEGYVSTGSEHYAAAGSAITAEHLDLDAGAARLVTSDHLGSLRVRARASRPVFVGVAPTRAVSAYLRGVAHSSVEDIDPVAYRAHAGERRPAAPAGQRFWAAAARGAGARSLTWKVRPGAWSVVVMNADGSRGVSAAVDAGVKLPFLSALAFGTLGGGLVFVAVTAFLTLVGTRPPAPRRLAPALA